jgi:4-amino-4-deoxy-L-arabinose transferase-like glycosyltransferase
MAPRRGTTWVPLALLAGCYLGSRLTALTALPMFLDESWHIRWSMWISLGKRLEKPWEYGKGLSVFLNALAFPWAASHYLWVSRSLSVAAGLLALGACIAVGRRLFGMRTALLAGALFVASPFQFFYDRLVLTDPLMSAFATLALLGSVRLAQDGRMRDGVLTGLWLALSVFSKALGVLVFFVPALATALVGRLRRNARPLAAAYGLATAAVAYPLWAFTTTTSTVKVAVAGRASVVERLVENSQAGAHWLWSYWTAPVVILGLAAIALAVVRRSRAALLLAAVVGLPLVAFAAVSTLWFPRYIVFLTPPFLVLAAWSLESSLAGVGRLAAKLALPAATGRLLTAGILIAVVLPGVCRMVPLWIDPRGADLPDVDRDQFVSGWPSGYGARETVAFVRKEVEASPRGLLLVVHGPARRTTPWAAGVEFAFDSRLEIRDLDLADPTAIPVLERWACDEGPALLVVSPVGSARAIPREEAWRHLGAKALTTSKPDGTAWDEIFRLKCPAREAPKATPGPRG